MVDRDFLVSQILTGIKLNYLQDTDRDIFLCAASPDFPLPFFKTPFIMEDTCSNAILASQIRKISAQINVGEYKFTLKLFF